MKEVLSRLDQLAAGQALAERERRELFEQMSKKRRIVEELSREVINLRKDWLNSDQHRFWQQALTAFVTNRAKEAGFVLKLREECLKRFWTDKELNHRHRRLLETLAEQIDTERNTFNELPQRQLIKQARVSESSAKQLLTFLEQRRYITKRHDKNRVLWKLKPQT